MSVTQLGILDAAHWAGLLQPLVKDQNPWVRYSIDGVATGLIMTEQDVDELAQKMKAAIRGEAPTWEGHPLKFLIVAAQLGDP